MSWYSNLSLTSKILVWSTVAIAVSGLLVMILYFTGILFKKDKKVTTPAPVVAVVVEEVCEFKVIGDRIRVPLINTDLTADGSVLLVHTFQGGTARVIDLYTPNKEGTYTRVEKDTISYENPMLSFSHIRKDGLQVCATTADGVNLYHRSSTADAFSNPLLIGPPNSESGFGATVYFGTEPSRNELFVFQSTSDHGQLHVYANVDTDATLRQTLTVVDAKTGDALGEQCYIRNQWLVTTSSKSQTNGAAVKSTCVYMRHEDGTWHMSGEVVESAFYEAWISSDGLMLILGDSESSDGSKEYAGRIAVYNRVNTSDTFVLGHTRMEPGGTLAQSKFSFQLAVDEDETILAVLGRCRIPNVEPTIYLYALDMKQHTLTTTPIHTISYGEKGIEGTGATTDGGASIALGLGIFKSAKNEWTMTCSIVDPSVFSGSTSHASTTTVFRGCIE